MTVTFTWLGHSAFLLGVDGNHALIDPFLTHNPLAPISAEDVQADVILVTHGHGDHIGDTAQIAQRTGATVVATPEICGWLSKQNVKTCWEGNLGGTYRGSFLHAKFVPAWHTCSLPDGSYGGTPVGYMIKTGGKTLYHAGDTCLFSDMQLLARERIDVAFLPIGDKYTMGIDDSIQAIQWLNPRYVFPMHYNTFPPIAQDVTRWAELVHRLTNAQPIVIDPAGTFTLE